MKIIRCVLLAMCVLAVNAYDLKGLQDIYDANIKRMNEELASNRKTALSEYAKTLQAFKDAFQAGGNLNGVLLIDQELRRVMASGQIEGLPAGVPAELKRANNMAVEARNQEQGKVEKKIAGLTAQYATALARLESSLTKDGKIQEAQIVMALREQLRSVPNPMAETNVSAIAAIGPGVVVGAAVSAKKNQLYMVVDLTKTDAKGKYEVTYLDDVPAEGWGGAVYTDSKMVFRYVEPGTFIMGSPETELARQPDEIQHKVTLTKGFYMTIAVVSRKQYNRMTEGADRAVIDVWEKTSPAAMGIFSKLRGLGKEPGGPIKTIGSKIGLPLDFPTEAQWEYACRAGTTTAFNSDKDLTCISGPDGTPRCPNAAEVGVYENWFDIANPRFLMQWGNNWGFYNMHCGGGGLGAEFCCDRYSPYEKGECIDPVGRKTSMIVMRGKGTMGRRSAARHRESSDALGHFRLVYTLP